MERLGLTILLCTLGLGSASVPIHILSVAPFAVEFWTFSFLRAFQEFFSIWIDAKSLIIFFYGDLKFRSDVLLSSVMKQDYFFKVRKNLCDRGSGCCGTGFISDFIIWNVLTYILIYVYFEIFSFECVLFSTKLSWHFSQGCTLS